MIDDDERPAGLLGQVLQQAYRLERVIGSGAMGTVYEATHLRLPRRFAIKMLIAGQRASDETMARFRREALVTSRLDHPNIVEVIDFYQTPAGQPYIVMELLVGRDLAQLIDRRGRLDLETTTRYLAQIAAGLGAAHSRGIVHRDLKPANIFVCHRDPPQHEQLKVMDFGMSKVLTSPSMLTQVHAMLGTPWYMAPEQVRGEALHADQRTDIYAVGVMLYEMLSGQLPFDGEILTQVFARIVDANPPRLCSLQTDLPAAVEQVVHRAISPEPDLRHRTIDALYQDFRRAARRAEGATTRPMRRPAMAGPLVAGGSLTEPPLLRPPPVESPPLESPPLETPPLETPPLETPPLESPPRGRRPVASPGAPQFDDELTPTLSPLPPNGLLQSEATTEFVTIRRPRIEPRRQPATRRPRLLWIVGAIAALGTAVAVGAYVARSGRLPEPRPLLGISDDTPDAASLAAASASTPADPPDHGADAALAAVDATAGPLFDGASAAIAEAVLDGAASAHSTSLAADAEAPRRGGDGGRVVRLRRRTPGRRAQRPPRQARPGTRGTSTEDHGFLRVAPTYGGKVSFADVYLDGQRLGTAPFDKPVPAGRHILLLRRTGYLDVRRQVTVQPGQRLIVRVPLKKTGEDRGP